MNKVKWQIIVAAIAALTVIECIAMSRGINGTLRNVIIIVIAALAGIVIPTPKALQ